MPSLVQSVLSIHTVEKNALKTDFMTTSITNSVTYDAGSSLPQSHSRK